MITTRRFIEMFYIMFCLFLAFIINMSPIFATLARGQDTGMSKSEVRLINNIPKLFVRGKELNTVLVTVYYIPDPSREKLGNQPKYSTEKWVSKIKAVIDEASRNKFKAILLNVWWGELDKSKERPSNISKNLDYANLDRVMDYASQKKVYIILITVLFPSYPEWWAKENNVEPFNNGGVCDLCETDSYGNIYNNVSMNNDKVHQDYGSFIEAIIKRYKNHPALIGWSTGVGATGEDNYGPNYIYLMGMGGGHKIERKPLMFTDYSPYFQRKFKEWITEKYKTDEALHRAWADNSVTLANLTIPKPQEMIINPQHHIGPFPDPAEAWFKTDVNGLTRKGRDFYDFRNYMRWADRKYYSKLIKKNDPDHILLFNVGLDEETLKDPSLCDGIMGNPNLDFGADMHIKVNQDFYYHMISLVKNAVNHKKLVIISAENKSDGRLYMATGKWETAAQIKYIETFGKAVKCANGMFAYVVDIIDEGSPRWLPTWFSVETKAAARRISDYNPTENCSCELISELYLGNRCGGSNAAPGCGLLERAYHSFCNK